MRRRFCCFVVAAWCLPAAAALNSRSSFHGSSVLTPPQLWQASSSSSDRTLTMRKQKASDRRTRRRQRGDDVAVDDWVQARELRASFATTVADSPMQAAGAWSHKRSLPQPLGARQLDSAADLMSTRQQGGGSAAAAAPSGGRGRSRKRSTLYNSLAFYHNKFLTLLTQEYQAEVRFGPENLYPWKAFQVVLTAFSLPNVSVL
jgi:hypothetical protein